MSAVWPNFYYRPIAAGKWTWLGLQGVCIAIYLAGVVVASGRIGQATLDAVATDRSRSQNPARRPTSSPSTQS